MSILRKLCILTTGVILLCSSCLWAQTPQSPAARDRCPVCGMFVAPYPEWIATIVKADASQIFFDGCKDMFRYYFKLSQQEREGIQNLYVTEYYTTIFHPVSKVFFVVGSDVYGPMGNELIPVAGEKNAETFMRDHNGRQILTFDQITEDLLPGD